MQSLVIADGGDDGERWPTDCVTVFAAVTWPKGARPSAQALNACAGHLAAQRQAIAAREQGVKTWSWPPCADLCVYHIQRRHHH
jgi:hypothetical protein